MLNQYNVYTKRIVSVCFYFQQSVLAALYSSEGSVMEVSSQTVTSQGADWKSIKATCAYRNLYVCTHSGHFIRCTCTIYCNSIQQLSHEFHLCLYITEVIVKGRVLGYITLRGVSNVSRGGGANVRSTSQYNSVHTTARKITFSCICLFLPSWWTSVRVSY